MNHLKSRIRNKENVRKTYFAFKLIFLGILEVFYAGNTLISPFLVQYEILNHVIRALIFLLSTNCNITCVVSYTKCFSRSAFSVSFTLI